MFRAFLGIAALLILLGGTAGAATVTFAGLTDPTARTFVEDGVTVVGNGDIAMYGAGHIDDGGTSAPSQLTFTMQRRFNALSFDLRPAGFFLSVCYDTPPFDCIAPTFANVSVMGFRGSSLVSSLLFDMGTGVGWQNIDLGSTFRGLTSLVIGVVYPDALLAGIPGASVSCESPCSHFTIDNVTLAPVPVPGAAPLAASGLALLAMLGLRRRRKEY